MLSSTYKTEGECALEYSSIDPSNINLCHSFHINMRLWSKKLFIVQVAVPSHVLETDNLTSKLSKNRLTAAKSGERLL